MQLLCTVNNTLHAQQIASNLHFVDPTILPEWSTYVVSIVVVNRYDVPIWGTLLAVQGLKFRLLARPVTQAQCGLRCKAKQINLWRASGWMLLAWSHCRWGMGTKLGASPSARQRDAHDASGRLTSFSVKEWGSRALPRSSWSVHRWCGQSMFVVDTSTVESQVA